MNLQFGSGVLFAKPVAGNEAANPTPYKFGVLQEASVDFKADLKKLYGQKQFPVATARGKIDVMLKAKLAVFDVGMLNQLYFGQTATVGVAVIADDEEHTVNSTTHTVTATLGTFETDWGVRYADTGQQLENSGAVAPAAGEYQVNTASGVYTFNTADDNADVLVSYTYTDADRGKTIAINNQRMGYAPEISAFLYDEFRTKYFAIELYDVTLGSISVPTKLEDFWIADIDGSANTDASDRLGRLMADLV